MEFKSYLPSDILRHICKYHNPYEDLYNKCLREFFWNMLFDDCKYILRIKLFSSSQKETYVVSIKDNSTIHCITLEPFYTGEFQRLILNQKEFMDVYWIQIIPTSNEPNSHEWLIHTHTYSYIPEILEEWEIDYEEYLEKIQDEE